MAHNLLNRDKVDAWVKNMLSKKLDDQEKRTEFLTRVRDGNHEEFVNYVEQEIANGNESAYLGNGDVPTLLTKKDSLVIQLTAGHMYLMPAEDIAKLYCHWDYISEAEAADMCFWGAVTLSEIRHGRIKPCWLAVDLSCDEDRAVSDLDKAIKDHSRTDRMVRRVLRWMMGPGHMRGAPELYGNCSLAKAWWCGRFAYTISEIFKEEVSYEDAAKSLQMGWLGLTDYLAGRLKVIGDLNVLCGIVLWLQQYPENVKVKRDDVEATIERLGEVSSWRVLGVQTPGQVLETITAFCQPAPKATAD